MLRSALVTRLTVAFVLRAPKTRILRASVAPSSYHNYVQYRSIRKNAGMKENDSSSSDGVRLNKCLPKLSRRQADTAIIEGKVRVGGRVRTDPGYRCKDTDVVTLNGKVQDWQSLAAAKELPLGQGLIYLKYWKPKGVTCTTDRSVKNNILDAGRFDKGIGTTRIFPVGRLDRDSTGIILVTSDGRLSNALLRPSAEKFKTYNVTVAQRYDFADIEALANGVMISSTYYRDRSRRDGSRTQIDLKTKSRPCQVIEGHNRHNFQITISEGRNRQIRRMCQARGLDVTFLHRIAFAGITLNGLRGPNDWKELSLDEINSLQNTIDNNTSTHTSTYSDFRDAAPYYEQEDSGIVAPREQARIHQHKGSHIRKRRTPSSRQQDGRPRPTAATPYGTTKKKKEQRQ